MTMSAGAKARLEDFRQLLAHINDRILPDVGFELWDKSTVPRELPADMPAVAIADEGAVAALVRRPNMHTILNLWVTQRIDIRNGRPGAALAHCLAAAAETTHLCCAHSRRTTSC